MRSKFLPVAAITTNTTASVNGTAAATTMPDAPAHAHEAHEHDHQQGDEKLEHELVDGRVNVDGLIGDLCQAHAQRQHAVDCADLAVQRLAEIEPVPAVAHDDAEQQRGFAVVADQECRRIFVTALDVGDVRQLQRAALHDDRRVADLLQVVEGAVEANEHFRAFGLHRAGRRQRVLAIERGEHVLRADAERCQPVMRELDVDALGLLADDVDLLHPRHVEQPLAQRLCIAHEQPLRFAPAPSVQRAQR